MYQGLIDGKIEKYRQSSYISHPLSLVWFTCHPEYFALKMTRQS